MKLQIKKSYKSEYTHKIQQLENKIQDLELPGHLRLR